MKKFFLKIKSKNRKCFSPQAGLTFVELAVVVSIFAVMSSIVLANYGLFQDKIDFKNLNSNIALKIIEAQRAALSGKFPPSTLPPPPSTWKPSYGIFINQASDDKSFIHFADLDQDGDYNGNTCKLNKGCLEQVTLPTGYTISSLDAFYLGSSTPNSINNLVIVFTRPNSRAVMKSAPPLPPNLSYVRITLTSPRGTTSTIKIYPSGRVQLN